MYYAAMLIIHVKGELIADKQCVPYTHFNCTEDHCINAETYCIKSPVVPGPGLLIILDTDSSIFSSYMIFYALHYILHLYNIYIYSPYHQIVTLIFLKNRNDLKNFRV